MSDTIPKHAVPSPTVQLDGHVIPIQAKPATPESTNRFLVDLVLLQQGEDKLMLRPTPRSHLLLALLDASVMAGFGLVGWVFAALSAYGICCLGFDDLPVQRAAWKTGLDIYLVFCLASACGGIFLMVPIHFLSARHCKDHDAKCRILLKQVPGYALVSLLLFVASVGGLAFTRERAFFDILLWWESAALGLLGVLVLMGSAMSFWGLVFFVAAWWPFEIAFDRQMNWLTLPGSMGRKFLFRLSEIKAVQLVPRTVGGQRGGTNATQSSPGQCSTARFQVNLILGDKPPWNLCEYSQQATARQGGCRIADFLQVTLVDQLPQ